MQCGGAKLIKKHLCETAHIVSLGLYAQVLLRLNRESGTGKEDGFTPCATGRADVGIMIASASC